MISIPRQQTRLIRTLVSSAFVTALALAGGCSDKNEVPLIKVAGYVKLGAAPLPQGIVEFHPDAAKGNKSAAKAIGMIKSDGSYNLMTDGKDGAPSGWYKISISPQGMPDASQMTAGAKLPTPPAIAGKYTKPESSTLTMEVKEGAAAGAYDIVLQK